MVCNEEGKINGLELNRALRDETGEIWDIVAGTCFICGDDGVNFISLTDEQLKYYMKKFRQPESVIKLNDKIISIPYEPEEEK